MTKNKFISSTYPSSRRFTFDVGRIGNEKHHVKALLEVDVTGVRGRIKEVVRWGDKVSFPGWLIKVIADTVALHPQVAGVNRPRQKQVVFFDDVDVSLVVEKQVKGSKVPLPFIMRGADRKSMAQLSAEIEAAKAQVFSDEGDYVLGSRQNAFRMRLFANLPQGIRLFLMKRVIFSHPRRLKESMGTVMVTTAGMIGRTRGWIIPMSMHPLSLSFGSLNKQAAVHKGELAVREILHLTVQVDHDVIDGIPAAKFVEALVRRIEDMYGL